MTDLVNSLAEMDVRAARAVALAGALMCGVGAVVVDGVARAGFLGAAVGVMVVGGAFLLWRRRLSRLPLVVAPVGLRGRYGPHRAYRFRARLGRGRPLSAGRAEVTFLPTEGAPIALSCVLGEVSRAVGPWTLVVLDNQGTLEGREGRIEVVVHVMEGGRAWCARRAWALEDLRPGRFDDHMAVRRGRLHVDPSRWDRVVADEEMQLGAR